MCRCPWRARRPLAWLGSDALAGQRRSAYGIAAGMRGLWDAWLWAPVQMGAAFGSVVEHLNPAGTHLLAEADIGATGSVGDVTADAGDLYGQLAFEVAQRDADRFQYGLRLQAVAITADSDPPQLATSPTCASARRTPCASHCG